MNESYEERKLSDTFKYPIRHAINDQHKSSRVVTVIGIPSVGISTFLKFICTRDDALYIHVDLYDLPTINKKEFFILLSKCIGVHQTSHSDLENLDMCVSRLKDLSKIHKKIVIVFNRFDQLRNEFDQNLFISLLKLTNDNTRLILSCNRTYEELSPWIFNESTHCFSNYVYLTPFSLNECIDLLKIFPEKNIKSDASVSLAHELSGGHFILFQLILRSQRISNFLDDSFIQLQVKQIYDWLNHSEKQSIRAFLNKSTQDINSFLKNIGFIANKRIFSPLLVEYIENISSNFLPEKELKLFNRLKQNLGDIVSKDEIVESIWGDEAITDWALNSLIYRLKKNKTFQKSGYSIISRKKQGYMLLKS